MSHTRQCWSCAEGRLAENVHGIAEKAGPAYERRMVGTIAKTLGVNKRVARQLVNAVLHPPAG